MYVWSYECITSFKAGNNLWSSQWRFLGLLNWKLFMGLFSSTFWTYNPFKSIQEENSRRLPVRGESTTSQGLRKHETTVYHKIQTWATLSNSRFCLFHTFDSIIQRSVRWGQSAFHIPSSMNRFLVGCNTHYDRGNCPPSHKGSIDRTWESS